MILLKLLPSLKIHSWGGFGSQLYTLHIALKLMKRFPDRRITIVNHSSGVTKRHTELDWSYFGIHSKDIDDFKPINQPSRETSRETLILGGSKMFKSILLSFAEKMSILIHPDDDESFRRIKFWTLMTRGHYTRVSLDENVIKIIYNKFLPIFVRESVAPASLIIHYRLGDLLNLNQKSPISQERLEKVIRSFDINLNKIKVLTDSSSDEYYSFTRGSRILGILKPITLSPIATLQLCIAAENFIGSTAKLSLWSAIFRKFVAEKNSYLPYELIWAKSSGLNASWY